VTDRPEVRGPPRAATLSSQRRSSQGIPPCPVQTPRRARPSPPAMLAPRRAGKTAPGRAGPTTPEDRARSAQNALKQGLRAQKYVVLPEETLPSSGLSRRHDRGSGAGRGGPRRGDLGGQPGSQARRPCSRGAARSPRGVSRGRIGWPPQLDTLVRDGWREPAPTLVVGALRPTVIAARRWPSSGARCAP
jgi:hypothetical protein